MWSAALLGEIPELDQGALRAECGIKEATSLQQGSRSREEEVRACEKIEETVSIWAVQDFPVLDPNWTAHEEVTLLEAVMDCGFGNWQDVANQMRTKSKEDCESHYMKHFINNPLFSSTLLSLKQMEQARTADTAIPFKPLPGVAEVLGSRVPQAPGRHLAVATGPYRVGLPSPLPEATNKTRAVAPSWLGGGTSPPPVPSGVLAGLHPQPHATLY
ncbi:TAD2A protein, partial [Polypterus senegalus]